MGTPAATGSEPRGDEESLVRTVQVQLGLHGPALTVAAACASGNVALAQGRNWLKRGWVDICLAGACDMWVTPLALASFGRLRVLSRRNDNPAGASRPFDRERDGFVMGEGGAMFVLEPAERARRRSAHAYAELAGHGATSDAFNLVIPNADPGPAVKAVRLALADAKVNPDQVEYVNAHGTSTPVGDACEAKVLRRPGISLRPCPGQLNQKHDGPSAQCGRGRGGPRMYDRTRPSSAAADNQSG